MTDDPQAQLANALVEFQAEVPTIPKNRTAKIPTKSGSSYSYKYADLADTWEAIRKPLHNHGLAVTQALSGGSSGWMSITTKVWHRAGATEESIVDLDVKGRTPQEVGSQVTYFKRYTLSAALGISTDEDDDGAGASARRPQLEEATETDPEVLAADQARAELLTDTAQYGWTAETLVKALWERKRKNLKTTRDVALIKGFGDELIAEAETGNSPLTGEQAEPPITDRQLRKLHTLLGLEHITSHDDKVKWCSDALGVPVASTKDLTEAEAGRLIDKLEAG